MFLWRVTAGCFFLANSFKQEETMNRLTFRFAKPLESFHSVETAPVFLKAVNNRHVLCVGKDMWLPTFDLKKSSASNLSMSSVFPMQWTHILTGEELSCKAKQCRHLHTWGESHQ